MAKPANSAEARAPPLAPRSPPATRATLGAAEVTQATCAPHEFDARLPRTLGAPRALRAQLRKLWNPGPMLGGGGPGPDAQVPTPSPGNPSCLQPREPLGPPISGPIPSPTIKTTSRPRAGGQERAGSAGLRPRHRPRADPGPSRHLRRSAPQPPDFSPPTTRLLCCSSSHGSLECTGLAEPSPAPPPPRLGEGLAKGGKRRGGDEREEERELQRPGRAEGPGPGHTGDPARRPGARKR